MFELKTYQKNTLETLSKYLELVRLSNPTQAFKETLGKNAVYNTHGLGEIPYVCLRLPTGGGKTLLASYAVIEAAKNYLEKDFPLVLWLVPTNTIREQTITALKNNQHNYRKVLDQYFQGNVEVFDIGDIENIRSQDLQTKTCVVVGTLATLRVQDTTGRKIYSHKESFEPHFSHVPDTVAGLELFDEGVEKGKLKFSFANICHLLKPLVIMDEAHNARTDLSFETLKRISPACIIEFTATPDMTPESGSNVLYSVSASELKTEHMIKLPIMLTEHQNWQSAVRDAVLRRKNLAEMAGKEPEYLRPIALYQAENKDQEVTFEVLKKHLIENEKVKPETIAVATGNQRELDGINLFDPACKIEHIITIDALKEGWDCSFAYVFCSVANIRSGKEVEQLLGRVLRMPNARRRETKELNCAYAHVSSPEFAQAARSLHDSLVNMGFEEIEAIQNIQLLQPELVSGGTYSPPPAPKLSFVMEKPIEEKALPAELKGKIEFGQSNGKQTVNVVPPLTDALESDVMSLFRGKEQKEEASRQIQEYKLRVQMASAPSERGEKFAVPQMLVMVQTELELPEREQFLDAGGWNILECPGFTDSEFSLEESAHSFEVDMEGKKVFYHEVDSQQLIKLDDIAVGWPELELVRWIDRQIRQPDIMQAQLLEFIRRNVNDLIQIKKISLPSLVRAKYILCKVFEKKIGRCRQEAIEKGYQTLLIKNKQNIEVSFKNVIDYAANPYPARPPFYTGAYRFNKHYYPVVGDLKASGEEFECATAIDRLPEVECWVRNIQREPEYSFWLPTSTDRFYPDFVAKLKDERILVIEYKGEQYETNDDSREKKNIGELWEEKSNGKGLFIMAVKEDDKGNNIYKQLETKVNKNIK